MKYQFLRLFLLVQLLSLLQLQAQSSLDSLELALESIAAQDEIPGFAVVLVDAEGILYEQGFGFSKLSDRTPYSTSTIQNIASISKTFIGISLQQAVDQGILSWDTPINDYLPYEVLHPKFPDQPILLSHLANHTSGIKDDPAYENSYCLIGENPYEKGDLDRSDWKDLKKTARNTHQALGDFCQDFLCPGGAYYKRRNFYNKAPGQAYNYSNVGAALAAFVLEQATGMSFPDWTRQYILEPLEMESSGWSMDEVDQSKHTELYYPNRRPIPPYTLSTYPDGGMITSVHDLGLYLSALISIYGGSDDSILSQTSMKHIIQPNTQVVAEEGWYGYFWETQDDGLIGHNGGDPGVMTFMYFNPETLKGYILFNNGYPSDWAILIKMIGLCQEQIATED